MRAVNSSERGLPMKMRASELVSAAILSDGSLSMGFRSSTDSHTLELSRKAQEQLLPALLASEPANLQKFFTAADVQSNLLAEGLLLTFPIRAGIAVRVLVSDATRRKLLAELSRLDPPAHSLDGT
jgi:hypothetical protein